MASDLRRHLGRLGENLASEHMIRRGFEILERNYRTRWGELDIIAFDGRALVFVEVKTRRVVVEWDGVGGGPFDAIGPRKRFQVRRMARSWLMERPERPRAEVLRFDAIGVSFDGSGRLVKLEHLEGAF